MYETEQASPGPLTDVVRPAPTDRAILPALAGRWSARAIDPARAVTRTQVATLLEAARWAPSSGNAQPWRYLVFDDQVARARDQARDCLRRGNAWARRAPVLLLSLAQLYRPDSDERIPTAHHDLGAASLSLCVQAVGDGLVAHQMAGFDAQLARSRFGIGDRFEPVAMIAIGHPGPVTQLDEGRREKETAPRQRRPVGEIARFEHCDGPAFSV
ncbi:nitroreductase family protein [soil metagenome]